MKYNVVEDIKSVSELKTNTRRVLEQVRATRRPVVVTVKGRPAVVVVDAAEFQRQQQALDLAACLSAGEADVRAGRVRPASDFLSELGRAKKTPR